MDCPVSNVVANSPYPNDPLMFTAWHECLIFTALNSDAIAHFEACTGQSWVFKSISEPNTHGLSQEEVEQLCGSFARWFTEHIWGDSNESSEEIPMPGLQEET